MTSSPDPTNIVFVSGVTLGIHALRGMIDTGLLNGDLVKLSAIFTLDETRTLSTSGYQPFDHIADELTTPLHKVTSMKNADSIQLVASYAPDLIFVIGWSELVPSSVLDIPKHNHRAQERHSNSHGCIGMHPTMLPIGRGRAPIPWSIIKGLKESGVTMFYLEDEADAGDIIAQRCFDITLEDDASSVYDKVSRLHYDIMREHFPLLVQGIAPRLPQDQTKATVWQKRTPEDGVINWNKPLTEQHNWIRGLTHPYPGAFFFWKGHKVVVWKATLGQGQSFARPGTVLGNSAKEMAVACPDGIILLQRLQVADGPELDGTSFAASYGVSSGDLLRTEG